MLRKVCLSTMCLLLATVSFAQTPRKTTLALMDLTPTGVSKSDAVILTGALLTELMNANVFEIVEISKRDEILKELGFQQSGACDASACIVEAGQLLGVQKMIGGSIGKLGGTWTVNIRLLDVKTGKVDKSCTKYYKGEIDQLLSSMKEIAQEIIQVAGPTKEQLEAMRQKAEADRIATAQVEQVRLAAEAEVKRQAEQKKLAAERATRDSLARVGAAKRQAELEAQRQAMLEKQRKQEIADSIAWEASRTKIKYPALTYGALSGGLLTALTSYYFHSEGESNYDLYLNATTPEDAAKYRDDTDKNDKLAANTSYVSIGFFATYAVSLFIRTKMHPELSKQSSLAPDLTPIPFPNREGAQGLGLTWRF